jgi:hypothetical protein
MHQVCVAQNAKMMGNGRLAHWKQPDKIANRKLPGGQRLHNLAPNRLG